MQRRAFLRTAAIAALAARPSIGLFAAPAAGAKLLVVFLRGGYDAANVLVPAATDFYRESRPNIAVSSPVALDRDWGLHPVLREPLLALWERKQLAFVAFAGTENLSRSHFETQDSIELGQPLSGPRNLESGFLNRLVALISGRPAMSFTDQLPLVFRGTVQVPNVALRTVGRAAVDPRHSETIRAMYRGTRLEERVSEGFAARDEVMRGMAGEMEAANRNAINARSFGLEARRIAKLMRERYDIGFVDVGGWDTHVGQGGDTGFLASRLEELGRGLRAFSEEMGERWRDTVVVVLSEFGRTFRENGNRGTDHGHGTVYWVLGGSIGGARVAGEQVRIERSTLFQDRDYPVLNDYRALFGGLFGRMYSLDERQVAGVFPQVKPRDLALV